MSDSSGCDPQLAYKARRMPGTPHADDDPDCLFDIERYKDAPVDVEALRRGEIDVTLWRLLVGEAA